MDEDMIVSLVVALVMFAAVMGIVIFEIVLIKRLRKKYMYRWQSHEIVFEIASRSVRLYVDGNIEDELGARDISVCTLRAFVEGTEVKARMTMRRLRAQLEVTAGDTPLQLMGVSK